MESVSTTTNGMRLSTFLSYEELNPFLAFTLIILTLIACYQTFLFKSPVALLLPKLPVALKVNVKSEDDLFIACADTAFNNKIKTILINEIGDYKSPWWYSPHLVCPH